MSRGVIKFDFSVFARCFGGFKQDCRIRPLHVFSRCLSLQSVCLRHLERTMVPKTQALLAKPQNHCVLRSTQSARRKYQILRLRN